MDVIRADERTLSGMLQRRRNVFADLGFADAAERQAWLRLAHALNQGAR